MNFFEHQDKAKQNTTKLVVLFVLGVLSLIIAVSIIVIFGFSLVDPTVADYVFTHGILALFEPELLPVFGGVALAVIGVVGFGAMAKAWQLNDGGKSVAQSLGGKLLFPNTQNFHEKRALNVVEEMAIASGIGVPPVYIIEEEGINAFAAGYGFQDAVVGVTRGCIEKLNREELQGVIAHEFSHIFHGDMKLNIRLVSWLHGMVIIGMFGRIIMRFSHTGSSNSRGKNSGVAAALAVGAALAIAGYAGSFFGGLIRAALSRQREYLADASAVQYTRNPDGIAGALKKIGANSLGASIRAPQAFEFSHLFFGDIVMNRFGSLMATHPPLGERILRLNPSWDGRFEAKDSEQNDSKKEDKRSKFKNQSVDKTALLGALAGAGMIFAQHISQAKTILNRIDSSLHQASHDPFLARVVIYGVLQDSDEFISKKQFEMLEDELQNNLEAKRVFKRLHNIDDELIIPIVELCIPALKSLSPAQKKSFYTMMDKIIKTDGKLSILEWSIGTIVRQSLEEQHPPRAHATLLTCKAHIQVVLSVLAHASGLNANEAFIKSFSMLLIGKPQLLGEDELGFSLLEHALMELNRLQPKHKERLANAMVTCIGFDELIKPREIQLFKAIALAIGIALPPLDLPDNPMEQATIVS